MQASHECQKIREMLSRPTLGTQIQFSNPVTEQRVLISQVLRVLNLFHPSEQRRWFIFLIPSTRIS